MFIAHLNAKWMDRRVSFYPGGHSDTSSGKPITLRQILFEEFIYSFTQILALKKLDRNAPDFETKKKTLKGQLAAYALNELESRRGKVLNYSHLMQFDWDFENIRNYDIEELKAAIFDLPFIAFCGISCTGTGFYAFAEIAEPEKLKQYAEHCFLIFEKYSIPVDTSKGRNYNDLRYVSYDCRMMVKDDPQPLKIRRFFQKPVSKNVNTVASKPITINGPDGRVQKALKEVSEAPTGNRWPTVRKAAYLIGGIPGTTVDDIKNVIRNSSQYAGYESHVFKCAEDSFNAGRQKPLAQ
jgi:hypothetical protein